MKTKYTVLLTLLLSLNAVAQNIVSNDIRINKYVEGTLLAPQDRTPVPLAIIINDFGATDRNGNQTMAKNDSARKLAERLADNGIATFRYDKRILKAEKLDIREKDIRFDDFIVDASSVINYFKTKSGFSKFYVIGHGQGSLVGMVTAEGAANGFISIAGAGQTIDSVLVEQIGRQAPGLKENARESFDELRHKGKTNSYSQGLESIFRKDIQAFMASWMAYDPKKEIKELNMPVLIINGDNDLQNDDEEANKLHAAKPDAKLVIIENMNHILRRVPKNDDLSNQKSYNEPQRPISDELVSEISNFIKEQK